MLRLEFEDPSLAFMKGDALDLVHVETGVVVGKVHIRSINVNYGVAWIEDPPWSGIAMRHNDGRVWMDMEMTLYPVNGASASNFVPDNPALKHDQKLLGRG